MSRVRRRKNRRWSLCSQRLRSKNSLKDREGRNIVDRERKERQRVSFNKLTIGSNNKNIE
jgi:hypothetical protein